MKRLLHFFLLSLIPFYSYTQVRPFSEEMHFVDHLFSNKQYSDAAYVLDRLSLRESDPLRTDSISYYSGWAYYNLKKLDTSSAAFSHVSPVSAFYYRARLCDAFNYSFRGNTANARQILRSTVFPGEKKPVVAYQLAGIALLERDMKGYEEQAGIFQNDPLLQKQSIAMDDYYHQLKRFRKKSPFLGALMSAIIPGSGKMYAGDVGQGIAALIEVGTLAGVTYENYHKYGLKFPQTIIFGGVFSVFYFGNIVGSYYDVKIRRNKKLRDLDNAILFDMHTPLGSLSE